MRTSGREPEMNADAIVVGLGAVGAAVALRLARRGLCVIGVDRFSPPHDHGSTHGQTRITRLAVGEGLDYVPLVQRSHELWREIEGDTGMKLLHQTGGLVIGYRDDAFLERTRAAAVEYGIAHETLSNTELKRRFPMFAADDRTEAYFEPTAGYVSPEAAVSAQLLLAEHAGAQLRLGERVISWTSSSAGVAVSTATATFEASELVLCAGAWIRDLFPQGRNLFAIYPQMMHWFPVRHGYEALRGMPIFIWETGGETEGFVHGRGLYGFPAIDGPAGGVKIGSESYDATVDPDELGEVDLAGAAATLCERVARCFPWVDPKPLRSIRCLYTSTRGSRFVVDRHPDHPNVTIVAACSGHGFKHSAAIGEAVAQIVVDGASRLDFAPFRFPPAVAP